MKHSCYILLITLMTVLTPGFSQTVDFAETNVLNEEQFNKKLNQQFTQVITGQDVSTVGSFAALDIADAKASFAANFAIENGDVLGVKFSGGASDGLSALVKDSEFNTAFSIESQYHWFPRKWEKSITLDDTELREWNKTIKKVKRNHAAALERISHGDTLALLEDARQEQLKKKKGVVDELEKLQNTGDEVLSDRLIKVKKMQIARIEHSIHNLQDKIDYIEGQNPEEWENERRLQINNAAFEALDKLENFKSDAAKITVRGFDIQWLSFGVKYGFDDFKLLDRTQAVARQVMDTSGHNLSLSLQYNKYRWHKALDNTYWFSVRTQVGWRNTSADLNKREIRDMTNIGAAGNLNRAIEDQYKVYEGDYEPWVPEFSLRPDLYWFLPKHNPESNLAVAFHGYGEWAVSEITSPLYQAGAGLLFSFLEREGQKSNINVEVFFELSDITNSGNTELGFWERNQFGLNFSVPLYIVNSN